MHGVDHQMQHVTAMVKAGHVTELANGDFTSGHPSLLARRESRPAVVVQIEDVLLMSRCELPGVHS